MDKNIQEKIDKWLNGNYDETAKNSIRKMQQENPDELEDAFIKS
jgi:phosphoglucomutase